LQQILVSHLAVLLLLILLKSVSLWLCGKKKKITRALNLCIIKGIVNIFFPINSSFTHPGVVLMHKNEGKKKKRNLAMQCQ